MKPQRAKTGMSDVPGIYHVGVPNNSDNPWQSASGGVGSTKTAATLAALGEGVERYAATLVKLPIKKRSDIFDDKRLDPEQFSLFTQEQRERAEFPFSNLYAPDAAYTNVYDFQDNKEYWTAHGLVALKDDYQIGVPTSSGLAAGTTRYGAVLRSIQELIERDALMTTWLHCLPGRRVKATKNQMDAVSALNGEMYVFDITPAYSPHPVCIVAGMIPERGKPRFSLGVACRETWQAALDKAYYEWCQGVFFAGYFHSLFPDKKINRPGDVQSFDDHAIYYTLNPNQWADLPLLSQLERYYQPPRSSSFKTTSESLESLRSALFEAKIRLFYRELTTIDALQAGVYVTRAISPDMTPIFAHQNWPLIGGKAQDVGRCYPDAINTTFPNLMPHPLG